MRATSLCGVFLMIFVPTALAEGIEASRERELCAVEQLAHEVAGAALAASNVDRDTGATKPLEAAADKAAGPDHARAAPERPSTGLIAMPANTFGRGEPLWLTRERERREVDLLRAEAEARVIEARAATRSVLPRRGYVVFSRLNYRFPYPVVRPHSGPVAPRPDRTVFAPNPALDGHRSGVLEFHRNTLTPRHERAPD